MIEHILEEYSLDIPFWAIQIFGGIFLAFSAFRIPYLSYLKEMIRLSFIISVVGFLMLDISHISIYIVEIVQLGLAFILHIWVIKLKPWHAFLIALFGSIASQFILLILAASSFALGLVTLDEANTIEIIPCIYQFSTFILSVGIGLFLQKKNLGFVFISDKMNFNPSLNVVNALIICSIMSGIISILLTVRMLVVGKYQFHVIAIGLFIIFDIILWAIYIRAKKEHEIHYRNMDTKQFFY